MLIYLITFVVSIIMMFISEKTRKNRLVSLFFFLVSIIVPCILASQRDLSIGGDTKGYIYGMYNLALSTKTSLLKYLVIAPPWYAVPKTIIGYMSLTWLCAQLPNGFQVLLFMIEFLSILPVCCAIKKSSNNIHKTVFGYTLYLLFFYNISLNAARQSIALSFFLLAFVYMTKKEYKKTILFSLIGFLFHDTALIILVVALVHHIVIDIAKTKKQQRRFEMIVIIVSIIAVVGFYPLLTVLVNTGVYSHGSIYLQNRRFDFSYIKTGLYLLVYLVILFNSKYMIKTREDEFYRFISLLSLIWLQAGVLITYADRLSWYLIFPVITDYLPEIACRHGRKANKKRLIYTAILSIGFLLYWIVLYGIINEHGTVPYISYKG